MVKHLHVPLEDQEHDQLVEWRDRVEKQRGSPFDSWSDFLLDRAQRPAGRP